MHTTTLPFDLVAWRHRMGAARGLEGALYQREAAAELGLSEKGYQRAELRAQRRPGSPVNATIVKLATLLEHCQKALEEARTAVRAYNEENQCLEEEADMAEREIERLRLAEQSADALRRRVEKLEAALRKHGQHEVRCALNQWPEKDKGFGSCNCRISALLAEDAAEKTRESAMTQSAFTPELKARRGRSDMTERDKIAGLVGQLQAPMWLVEPSDVRAVAAQAATALDDLARRLDAVTVERDAEHAATAGRSTAAER